MDSLGKALAQLVSLITVIIGVVVFGAFALVVIASSLVIAAIIIPLVLLDTYVRLPAWAWWSQKAAVRERAKERSQRAERDHAYKERMAAYNGQDVRAKNPSS